MINDLSTCMVTADIRSETEYVLSRAMKKKSAESVMVELLTQDRACKCRESVVSYITPYPASTKCTGAAGIWNSKGTIKPNC